MNREDPTKFPPSFTTSSWVPCKSPHPYSPGTTWPTSEATNNPSQIPLYIDDPSYIPRFSSVDAEPPSDNDSHEGESPELTSEELVGMDDDFMYQTRPIGQLFEYMTDKEVVRPDEVPE